MMTLKKVFLSTGGTGGHVFPALKLAQELKQRGHQVFLLTDQRGEQYRDDSQTQEFFDDVYLMTLHSGSGGMISKVRQWGSVLWETLRTIRLFRSQKPDIVGGFGGYTSAPALLAAKVLSIPFVIHEQNAVLGRVNRRLAPYARFIGLGFPQTDQIPSRCVSFFVGNPIRDEVKVLAEKPQDISANEPFRLLVFGGSQGASLFARTIPKAIASLPPSLQEKIEIVMQVRAEDQQEVQETFSQTSVKIIAIKPFFKDMPQKLFDASFVIARAGAMTVSEIALMGRPTLFIPLKIAMDNHQFHNVKQLVAAQAAWMVEEKDLSVKSLTTLLEEVIKNPQECHRRGEAIRQYSASQAAEHFANHIEEVIHCVGVPS